MQRPSSGELLVHNKQGNSGARRDLSGQQLDYVES